MKFPVFQENKGSSQNFQEPADGSYHNVADSSNTLTSNFSMAHFYIFSKLQQWFPDFFFLISILY